MKEPPAEQKFQDRLIPLLGRRDELSRLISVLRVRRSCLVSGPRGIGKTRLIEEALYVSGQPAVTSRSPRVLHQLLVELAHQLSCPAGHFGDVRRATTLALKPTVQDALREKPRCVVLDDVAGADPRMYRCLQQLYHLPRVCLIVGAKSRDSLGHLRKLLWDPREEIPLNPLGRAESSALFESACQAFQLQALNVDEFRSKVLAAAQGNPGQILTMCRMASRPEYQTGRHIMFLPLRIDALTEFV